MAENKFISELQKATELKNEAQFVIEQDGQNKSITGEQLIESIGAPVVVQETGDSTEDVMSQKAVTDALSRSLIIEGEVKRKLFPESSFYTQSSSVMEWSEWVDANTYVYSKWFDATQYNEIMFIHGTGALSEIGIEVDYGSNAYVWQTKSITIYDPNNKPATSFPYRTYFRGSLEGANLFRFKWKCPTNLLLLQYELTNETSIKEKVRSSVLEEMNKNVENISKSLSATPSEVFTPIVANSKVSIDYTEISGLAAVFNDKVITIQNSTLTYSEKGIEGYSEGFETLEVNSSNFPELFEGSTISRVMFLAKNNSENDIVSILITSKNQIYYSDGGSFGNYQLCDVWAPLGVKHPLVGEEKDPSGVHYKLYIPSSIENLDSWYDGMNCNAWVDSRGLFFSNYCSETRGERRSPAMLFRTIDGKNIYCRYSFGAEGRLKYGTTYDETYYKYNLSGDEVDTSSNPDYNGGLVLNLRTDICPHSTNLEPAENFEFGEDIVVENITKGTTTKLTLADASSLKIGYLIRLKGDVAGWENITNKDASGVSVGNEIFFVISAIEGNNITLRWYVGNPSISIQCRHIHSINEYASGVIIGTGEEYPNSWLIYYNEVKKTSFIINRTEFGVQRTLGVVVRGDSNLLFSSDTANVVIPKFQFPERTLGMGVNSTGLWLGKITDVDDWSKFDQIIDGAGPCYFFGKTGSSITYCSQYGKVFMSFDQGYSFEYLYTATIRFTRIIGFDKNQSRIFMNNGIVITLL